MAAQRFAATEKLPCQNTPFGNSDFDTSSTGLRGGAIHVAKPSLPFDRADGCAARLIDGTRGGFKISGVSCRPEMAVSGCKDFTMVPDGGGTFQDPKFNAAGNETSYTIGAYNRVMNDGTYSYACSNESSRTKLSDSSYEVDAYDHRQRLTLVTSYIEAGVIDIKTK